MLNLVHFITYFYLISKNFGKIYVDLQQTFKSFCIKNG